MEAQFNRLDMPVDLHATYTIIKGRPSPTFPGIPIKHAIKKKKKDDEGAAETETESN